MKHTRISAMPDQKRHARALLTFLWLTAFLTASMLAQDATHQTETFPETAALLDTVTQHEKMAELEIRSFVFKDEIRVSELEAKGQPRTTTETRYFDRSKYDPFAFHISTNDKSLSIPFSEILSKSRVVPVRWSEVDGKPVILFSFEPQAPVAKRGDLENRIAGDLKGTVAISPGDASIVRMNFRTASPIALAMGFQGRIDSLEGSVEMEKASNDLWLPNHQEFVTQGKNVVAIVAGIRFSQKFRTQQTDELSRFENNLVRAQIPSLPSGD